MSEQKLTAEQEKLAKYTGFSIGAKWARLNPTFKQTVENANKMTSWVVRNCKDGMTMENLDLAFKALKDELDNTPQPPPPPIKPEKKETFPWSTPESVTLTKQAVGKADAKTFLEWRKHPAFKEQLIAIGIKPW